MHRRDLFKLFAVGAAMPAFDSNLLAAFQAAQPSSGYKLQTLTAHQNDTIIIMTDLIIPETDTPGAKAVRVNEFIDLILTDWAHDDERKRFLNGLEAVDTRSNELFGKNFTDVTCPQQEAILSELDQQFAVERENLAGVPYVRRPHNNQLTGSFFSMLKRMTLYGYYTSEIGFKQELRKEIIPGAYHGCAPLSAASKA